MSIIFGDKLEHSNPIFPIADISDIKGGLRTIPTFSNTDLYNAFNGIPDKLKQNYSNLIVTSTNKNYYLSGTNATITTSWTLVGSGLSASGTTNSIPKWIGSTSLGDSLITDNGDTITITGNLTVLGTSSTITSENLLIKDPIILLAGSQSTPQFDSGLFVNRGTGDTQAFIWDESATEFKFISTTSSSSTLGNVSIGTYSNVRTGALSVGEGTTASSRFSVSSTGGTLSLVVNEQGDTIFSGDTKIFGKTFSNLPPGSITFGGKTAIYSPENNTIVIGTSILDTYYYNYGWKFNGYQIENLGGNAIEFRNSIGTIGNLWVGTNYTLAGFSPFVNTQQSTLFVKGTTSSIMKVVGTGATWSNSASIFEINNSGAVSIGTSQSMSGSKLFIQSNTASTTIGSNVMLDLYNGDITASGNQVSEIAFSADTTAAVNSFNTQHRYAAISGYATTWNNVSTGGGIKFSTRASTDSTLTEKMTISTIGNVGLGTTSPSNKLHVYATQSGAFRLQDGTEQNDYVLKSDSNGVASWASLSTFGISGASGSVPKFTGTSSLGTSRFSDNGVTGFYGSATQYLSFISGGNTWLTLTRSQSTMNFILGNPQSPNFQLGQIQSTNTIGLSIESAGYTQFKVGLSYSTSLVLTENGSVYNAARGSNTLYGLNALLVSTGINNVAIGTSAMQNNLGGVNNTAVGMSAMASNVSGSYNTAVGCQALTLNSGYDNTAIGISSQQLATQSSSNVSVGRASLYSNLSSGSVAIGTYALTNNTIGAYNTAVGCNSLQANTTTVASLIITDSGSSYTPSTTFSNVQLSYISGSTAMSYPILDVYVGSTGSVSTITLVTKGSGFKNTSTIMGANLGTGVTFSVSISSLQSGDANTAVGYQSMYSNINGIENTAIGTDSLFSNTTGYQNTAIGFYSMISNTTGYHNTAVGYRALQSNKTGWGNVVVGHSSLYIATQSSYNTAVGYGILTNNTSGQQNTAIGFGSLQSNTTGTSNSTLGMYTLLYNTTGSNNISIGQNCLLFNTTGSGNIAIGTLAGSFDLLSNGLTNSNTSIFIGDGTKAQSDNQTNQIVIGVGATGSGSNSVTLGASTITKTKLRGTINIGSVLQYASNSAALSAGLVPGDIYQTPGNVLMVVV